jgi:hypothetical protein
MFANGVTIPRCPRNDFLVNVYSHGMNISYFCACRNLDVFSTDLEIVFLATLQITKPYHKLIECRVGSSPQERTTSDACMKNHNVITKRI